MKFKTQNLEHEIEFKKQSIFKKNNLNIKSNMRYPIIYILTFFFSFNHSLNAKCLLPQTNSVAELISHLEQRDGWDDKFSRVSPRLANYNQKSKVDSVYNYAIQYFEDLLPPNIICGQVDINDISWLQFTKREIRMYFAFYLDSIPYHRDNSKIRVSFTYNFEELDIKVSFLEKQFWIPNCKMSPDSCNFLVTTKDEILKVSEDVNFSKPYQPRFTRSEIEKPPFHFEVQKIVNDDCGMQSLFIDAYTLDTLHSPIYKRSRCRTLKEKIDQSTLVVDGTIVGSEVFSISKGIHTKVEIEIHHIFKGEPKTDKIFVVIFGGRLFGKSASQSHGLSIGSEKNRYFFFLNQRESARELIDECEKVMGTKVYLLGADSQQLPKRYNPRSEMWKPKLEEPRYTAEQMFKRFEKITNQKRIRRLEPQNLNESILKEKKIIPDRENGVAAFLKIKHDYPKHDTLLFTINLSGTNDYYYLNQWEMILSYNKDVFGDSLVSNKIIGFKSESLFPELYDKYNFKIEDKTDDEIKLAWKLKDSNVHPIEFSDSGLPLIEFKIKINNIEEPMNLELNFTTEPTSYNYIENNSFNIPYQYTSPIIAQTAKEYSKPIIYDFFPTNGSIGDTITVTGKYLTDASVFLFGKSYTNRRFYKPVNKKFIIHSLDEEIQFIIPPYMQDKWSDNIPYYDSAAYIPITNTISISSPLKRSSSTKNKLEITNR